MLLFFPKSFQVKYLSVIILFKATYCITDYVVMFSERKNNLLAKMAKTTMTLDT